MLFNIDMIHLMILNLKPISFLIHLWNICWYYVFIVHIFFKFNITWIWTEFSNEFVEFPICEKNGKKSKIQLWRIKSEEDCESAVWKLCFPWNAFKNTWKLLHEFMLSIDLIISKWINWTNENQASSILSSIKMNILFQSFHRRTIRAPHVYFCAQKIMLSHLIGCRKSVDARYQYIDTVGMDKNVGTCVSYA